MREEHQARRLHFYRPKTKERLTSTYWIDGKYVESALSDIDHIMRDHRKEVVRQIDTTLLDLLHRIQMDLGACEPFHILSGYRCPETNAMLRKQGWAVSNKSFHEKGKAIDIRLPQTQISLLRRAAYRQKKGGVGYYPKLNFVHIDVGSVRYWTK